MWASDTRATGSDVSQYEPPAAGQVKVLRDKFGVPHIIAGDDLSLLFGVGYAQAEDQLENICKNYLRVQGRVAEHEGLPELPLDHIARMLQLSERAERALAAMPEPTRKHLEAFTAGINAYLAEHRSEYPEWVQPARPVDVVGFAMFVDTMFCVSHCRDDLEKAGIKIGLLADNRLGTSAAEFGSNQFAIRPARSTTGSVLLSMDPHLRHNSFFRWYEMHLVSPSLNVMGACFFGTPYVSMGRTEKTAWCMTVNSPDLGDVFVFDVNPDNPEQYRDLEGWKPLIKHEEVYKVQGKNGKSGQQKIVWHETEMGPAVKVSDGKAYVFALPFAEGPNRVQQLFEMAKAQNLTEFKKSLEPLGIVMFNIVYGDTAGDIFYVSNMRVPRRDTRIGSHELRPGNEEWARWQGFHTLEELPQVTNPPAGYLLNCNSGPQNVCQDVAPKPEDFPPYFMSYKANSRSRRLNELLSQDESISFDELHKYAIDTHIEAAEEWVPLITSTIREQAEHVKGDKELYKQVGQVLDAWDQRTDLDSRGAVLFVALMRDKEFLAAGDEVNYDRANAALLRVAAAVKEKFGALDVPWSEFSRIQRGTVDVGVAGCGITAPMIGAALRPTYGEFRDGKRYCTGGSSYGMLIDFAGPTKAVSCLPYGVSEHADSPHFADQLPLYVKGEFKPAWFWPEELRENTESVRTLDVRM
jgi:acyl-homoserine-lactone acylase